MNRHQRCVLISFVFCGFIIFGFIKLEKLILIDVSPFKFNPKYDTEKFLVQDPFQNKSSNAMSLNERAIHIESNLHNNSKSLKYLPITQSKSSNSLKQKNETLRCPNDNGDNWNFTCTVQCANEPPISGYEDRIQIHIDCTNPKPVARFIKVKTSETIQMLPENSECLLDYIQQSCYDGNLVPNLAHYIWFSKRQMNFYHLLSVLSASKFLKPCLILIHGDFKPDGVYWQYLLTRVPNIIHVYRIPPETVFGIPLAHNEHKADIGRIEALQLFGGIYIDTDEIILKSLDNLRAFPFTLSHAFDYNLSNGLIISKQNATFLNLWLSQYKTYNGKQWGFHSTIVPFQLSKKYPDLIHVEDKTFVRPNGMELPLLFKRNFNWSKNYAIHLFIRFYKSQHNVHDIRYLNTTIGSVARHVIYDSKDLCKN